MKVGILSMQEVKNYGSFLQAWSLKHNIEALGHTCEFINIVPGEQLGEYRQGRFTKIRKLITRLWGWDFVKRFKTIKAFQGRFKNEFLPELGVKAGEVSTAHYDTVVIGSDEVFNCAQKTWFGFSRQLFGDGLNADRVISYAGSFGATDVAKLKKLGIEKTVASLLRNFSAISVRDTNSFNTVMALTGMIPEKHLDPVFIYDYDKEMPLTTTLSNYMIVYTYPGRITDREEIAAIKSYAKAKGLKLISIGHYFPWCDEVIVPHPFEVLTLFKNASCIVTDTFHGSVFSIKYNKRFCTLVRDMNNNKLRHLLQQFALSSRIARTPETIDLILERDIDYTKINQRLMEEKVRSISYLNTNI